MKFKTFTLLFFITISLAFGQQINEEFQLAILGTNDGARLIINGDKHSLSLDIVSKNIKPLEEKPGCFYVDDKIIQTGMININSFLNDNNAKLSLVEAQQKLLIAYYRFGLNYVKNEMNVPYTNPTCKWITINNKTCLLWNYTMSGEYPGTKNKNVNLSMICFSHILNINTLLESGQEIKKSEDMLMKIANTLKENNFKIDLNTLQKKTHPYKAASK